MIPNLDMEDCVKMIGKLESGYGKIDTMLSYTICMHSYIDQNMASYFN